jgi:hypothetical protein
LWRMPSTVWSFRLTCVSSTSGSVFGRAPPALPRPHPSPRRPCPAALAEVRKKHRHHLELRAPLHDPLFDSVIAWLVTSPSRELP